MNETHVFTKKEEIVNAITHGLGALLSIAALVLLISYSAQYGQLGMWSASPSSAAPCY